jgi:hypothetical protein
MFFAMQVAFAEHAGVHARNILRTRASPKSAVLPW